MLVVQIILISILMIQTNSQSAIANCSFTSDCASSLTSEFTKDCHAGRLSEFAKCLWNHECLDPETASTQLEEHYCEETGCMISCIGKTCIRIYKARDGCLTIPFVFVYHATMTFLQKYYEALIYQVLSSVVLVMQFTFSFSFSQDVDLPLVLVKMSIYF